MSGRAVAAGFFLRHHTVRALGYRSTGENPHRFTAPTAPSVGSAGRRLPDDAEARPIEIRRAQRIAIHRRGSERRLIASGADRLRQGAAGGRAERDRLGAQGLNEAAHFGARISDGYRTDAYQRS